MTVSALVPETAANRSQRAGFPLKPVSVEATARDFFTPLESVRGIGALLVLLIHSCVWLAGDNWSLLSRTVWQLDTTDELVRRLILVLINGNAALSLFFVLSGFVLALSLSRDRRTVPAMAGAFTARRFLRIYPALAVNLVLTIAVLLAMQKLFPSLAVQAPTSSELKDNLLLVDYRVNGPTWSLLVELLAIPLLLVCHVATQRFGMRGLLLILALCIAGLFFGDRVLVPLLHPAGPFAAIARAYLVDFQFMFVLGMVVAVWHARGMRIDARLARVGFLVAVLALMSARALFGFNARSTFLIEGLASGAIIALLVASQRSAVHRALEWHPVRFLGRVSYSFYLYHGTALAIVGPVLVALMSFPWLHGNPYSAAALTAAAAIVVTVALAWLSYKFIERPSMRLGRSI
jgi:peptidoglycan/LPS O-acetylase OafA/YrhL